MRHSSLESVLVILAATMELFAQLLSFLKESGWLP